MKLRYCTCLLAALLGGCAKRLPEVDPISGGNPRNGQALVARYGCASCHQIEGIAHADSQVGPSLKDIRDRSYVGGVLPNTAANLELWIMHPRAFVPNTAMPELGVSANEARDMAAYLYNQ